jgi:hypothetical protein
MLLCELESSKIELRGKYIMLNDRAIGVVDVRKVGESLSLEGVTIEQSYRTPAIASDIKNIIRKKYSNFIINEGLMDLFHTTKDSIDVRLLDLIMWHITDYADSVPWLVSSMTPIKIILSDLKKHGVPEEKIQPLSQQYLDRVKQAFPSYAEKHEGVALPLDAFIEKAKERA